jgi:DNA-directed RNA polymerase specialized sigma54-like protein
MRVLITDNQGNKTEIEAKNLEIGNRTLLSILEELTRTQKEFLEFKRKYELNEIELHKLWGKLR